MKVGIKMENKPTESVKVIRDDNRDVIGEETTYQIPANNDRENGIVFNTFEVPVLYVDSTEEEEERATEEAKQIIENEKLSADDADLL